MNETVEGNKKYMEDLRVHLGNRKGHRANLHWIPAFQEYNLICVDCGENLTLSRKIEISDLIIAIDGTCNPPETLNISVKEEVGVKDIFGGK